MKKEQANTISIAGKDDFCLMTLMTPASARQFFRAVQTVAPRARRFYWLPMSLRSYPQMRQVAIQALKTFKDTARPSHWTQWLPQQLSLAILSSQYAGMRQRFEQEPTSIGLCWNGLDRSRYIFSQAARDAGCPCLYAELAPLPNCLAIDPEGVNALNSLPREPNFYLQWASRQPSAPPNRLQGTQFPRRKAKITPKINQTDQIPKGPYVFVPLQVPGDSQIRYFGDWIHSMQELVEAVTTCALQLPEGWHVRIKEHPSSQIDLSEWIKSRLGARCHLVNALDTYDLIKHAGAVLTVNSSVGLQAFFFHKPVMVLGLAFYGFDPLVSRIRNQEQLSQAMKNIEQTSVHHVLRDAYMRYLLESYYFPGTLTNTRELSNDQCMHMLRLIRQALQSAQAA